MRCTIKHQHDSDEVVHAILYITQNRKIIYPTLEAEMNICWMNNKFISSCVQRLSLATPAIETPRQEGFQEFKASLGYKVWLLSYCKRKSQIKHFMSPPCLVLEKTMENSERAMLIATKALKWWLDLNVSLTQPRITRRESQKRIV